MKTSHTALAATLALTLCAGAHAAEAKKDYKGDAWILVEKGTCASIRTPQGYGSLTPRK